MTDSSTLWHLPEDCKQLPSLYLKAVYFCGPRPASPDHSFILWNVLPGEIVGSSSQEMACLPRDTFFFP